MPRQGSNSTTRRTNSPKKPIAAPKRAGKSATRAIPTTPTPVEPSEHDVLRALETARAEDMYQQEKRRRAGSREAHDPLAEARREYEALLASEAGTPRGGRPRKGRPKKSEVAIEDSLEEFKGTEQEPEEE